MSYSVIRPFTRPGSLWLALAATSVLPLAARAQKLEKVADFRNVFNNDTGVYVGGSSNPYDNAIQIDNRLWFTTNTGGLNSAGTISYYDLTTKTITAYVSLGASGNTPQSSLTAVGNTLYFTTIAGGTGATGTISSVDISATTPVVNTLVNFGVQSGATNPRNPGGSLTAIPRVDGSTDLYFTTPNGGTGATGTSTGGALGTIGRYNTGTGLASTVYNFTTAPTSGRQPMEGFTNVGGKLYFTTMVGGANVPSAGTNGAGTLSVFDPVTGTVSIAANLTAGPVGSATYGNGQFAAHNVTQGISNPGMLYFTTVGSAQQPGSLQSYNLDTGALSTLYAFSPAVNSIFPDGRFAYGSVLEYNSVLYFVTMAGGLYGRGTIDTFNLATNTFSKLYDLDGGAADNRNYLGQGVRGGFTLVTEDGVDYLYLLTNGGGRYNSSATNLNSGQGTILRLMPVPEPGTVALLAVAGAGTWFWRRRRHASSRPALLPPRPAALPGRRQRAFTLIELLIAMCVVAVLVGVAFPIYRSTIDKSREIACMSNLRQIGAGCLLYAADHGGYYPNSENLGLSLYRRSDDPMGLPVLLGPYVGTENTEDKKVRGPAKIWLCPAGRPSLKEFGNNYAWTCSGSLTTLPMAIVPNPATTTLAWDNYTITLPTTYNVPEPKVGPTAAPQSYRFAPHRRRTITNRVYADGHVGYVNL